MRELTALHGLPADVVYKEVVIIGNGPSGICMSHQLSGHWGQLRDGVEHPDSMLAARLANCRGSARNSWLPSQPLAQLAEGLEGRSRNPLPLLVDCLMHPGADMGLDLPPVVQWKYYPEKQIDHVVLGGGRAGGSWHSLDAGVLTLSPARWMSLPGMSLPGQELQEGGAVLAPEQRAPVTAVANYLHRYVRQQGLQRFFREHTLVTSVKPIKLSGKLPSGPPGAPTPAWSVSGYDSAKKEPFRYVCSRVILATGASDRPNSLAGVSTSGTLRTPTSLQQAINTLQHTEPSLSLPVLVVGSGLSAADAILRLHARGIRVSHACRGASAALKALPPSLYPEYYKVHQMMKEGSSCKDPLYDSLAGHNLMQITCGGDTMADEDPRQYDMNTPKLAKLMNQATKEVVLLEVSCCVVLIGSRPDLHFLPENYESNYLTWDANSESIKPDVLAKMDRSNETNTSVLNHGEDVCIKCSYNKTLQKDKQQLNGFRTCCFLKTQWYNFGKYLVGQGIQRVIGRSNENKADEELKTNDDEIVNLDVAQTDAVDALNVRLGQSVLDGDLDLKLEEQGCGIGLGIYPDKPIDGRSNPIAIDLSSHAVLNAPPGMYALGPLTGDNFVRFIPGGAVAIVSDIWNQKKTEESNMQDCPV